MFATTVSASLYVLLNQFNVDTGAFFLPKAGHAFLFVAALHCFRLEMHVFYRFHDNYKPYRGKRACLGTVIC